MQSLAIISALVTVGVASGAAVAPPELHASRTLWLAALGGLILTMALGAAVFLEAAHA